jgi:site-specific DNA-cytosine methylase
MGRFQGMPDDYVWSDDAELAAYINGNAVPPPWYEWLVGPMVAGR